MRDSRGTGVLVGLAIALLGSGFAAGVVVGPRLRAESAPPVAQPMQDRASVGAPPVALARGGQSERHGAAQVQLAIAASALSRVPQLRPEIQEAAPRGRPQMKLEDLPPAVQKVLHQVALGQPVQWKTIEPRERNGVRYFKAEFDVQGMEQEYAVDEQGKILASESDVAVGELSVQVTSGIQSVLPGAVLMEAERNQQVNAPPYYDIEIQYQGQRRDLHVGEDGRIIRQRVR